MYVHDGEHSVNQRSCGVAVVLKNLTEFRGLMSVSILAAVLLCLPKQMFNLTEFAAELSKISVCRNSNLRKRTYRVISRYYRCTLDPPYRRDTLRFEGRRALPSKWCDTPPGTLFHTGTSQSDTKVDLCNVMAR